MALEDERHRVPPPTLAPDHPDNEPRTETVTDHHPGRILDPRPFVSQRVSVLGLDKHKVIKFDWRYHRDIYGHDLAFTEGRPGIPGISLDECARRCDQQAACQAFSFDNWNGWCFLKSKVDTSLLDPSSILGVKKPGELPKASTAQAQMRSLSGKIFKDQPMAQQSTKDADACGAICKEDLRCVAFSFIKKEKDCKLFNRSEGYYSDAGADSGYKRQVAQ